MIVFVFVAVYLVCCALVVAVMWQDRRRGATRTPGTSNASHDTHAHTLVFRTHV